jgi:hypothetical protein
MNKASFGVALAALIAGCSGSGGSAPSQSVAESWPARWCQAMPGIAREQLVSLMGQPTNQLATQMVWAAHRYHFTAFFDPDGTVKQLDINSQSLSAAEQAALKCGEVRTRRSMLAAQAVATPARKTPDACTLVSEAEMSAILGTPVIAKAPRRSKCIYKPASEISPYAEFSVDWGDGKAAMSGIGMAEQHEPGMTSPYDGLGDQAAAVGPALMIRTGDDLITIVLSGVTDAPASAKKIFDTAHGKM